MLTTSCPFGSLLFHTLARSVTDSTGTDYKPVPAAHVLRFRVRSILHSVHFKNIRDTNQEEGNGRIFNALVQGKKCI